MAAIAGGVAISFPQKTGHLYQEGSILSADGHCRPFDERASGTVFSDGAGVVVLKRTSDALRDGNVIYAVIKGVAVNNDGADRASFTAPSVSGQESVVRAAQKEAGVSPKDVGFIEAHGTATPLGDPIEVEALKNVFGANPTTAPRCVVGSVKGNLGHITIASGIAGFIKAVLAVYHGVIPGTLHFKKLNPRIDVSGAPLTFSSSLEEWPRDQNPRIAGVSAFGFGGSNAHVVIGEFRTTDAEVRRDATSLEKTVLPFPLSARSPLAFQQVARQLMNFLENKPNVSLFDVSHTLLRGRRNHEHRRVLEAHSTSELVAQLRLIADAQSDEAPGVTEDQFFAKSRGAAAIGGRFIALPTYPFQKSRHWVGPLVSEVVEPAKNQMSISVDSENHSLLEPVIKLFEGASGLDLVGSDARTPFVELGIDSLILTQVAIDLRTTFGVEVTFSQLLSQFTTFETLSDYLAKHARPEQQKCIGAAIPTVTSSTATSDGVLAQLEQMSKQLENLRIEYLAGGVKPTKEVTLPRSTNPLSSAVSELPSSATAKPFGPALRISTAKTAPLLEVQRSNLDAFIERYTKKTLDSKSATVAARQVLADPRVVSGFRPLMKELTYPIVVNRSEGATLWDVDGNRYIDFTCGFGSNFFGHRFPITVQAVKDQLDQGFEVGPQHPLAAEVASLIAEMVEQERVAFCNTGSEAVLGAVRIARTVTGRKRVAIFTGGYHGIFDEMVVREGRDGAAVPAAPGILRDAVANTVVLPWAGATLPRDSSQYAR